MSHDLLGSLEQSMGYRTLETLAGSPRGDPCELLPEGGEELVLIHLSHVTYTGRGGKGTPGNPCLSNSALLR